MKILNLTHPKESDLKFEISRFPDGQQQVTIDLQSFHQGSTFKFGGNAILIRSRLNDFRDLELIICTVASLRNLGVMEIHLFVPLFLGSRSDRKFLDGSNNYLKQVICPIINSLNLTGVTVLDPHSDVLEACLNNFKKVSNSNFVTLFAIPEIIKKMNLPAVKEDIYHTTPKRINYDKRGFDKLVLISPDAGANKKIFAIAEEMGYTKDIVTCSKSRDTDGKLTHVQVPLHTVVAENKDFVIIDDICDGGRTFLNIAEKIFQYMNTFDASKRGKIYLVVTHGIFSAGFEELHKHIDTIYCTNSYREVGEYEHNSARLIKTNTHQLKII